MRRTAAAIAAASVGLAALKVANDFVAATALLFTLGVLAASLLDLRRTSWRGFAIFGWGYLAMAWNYPQEMPTTTILNEIYSHVGACEVPCLDQPLALDFQKGTPIEDVLEYVKATTGIQYYLDPEHIGCSRITTASIQLEGVPLRLSLKLMLEQMGLSYHVEDKFIRVSDETRSAAFYWIGQYWFALLAGCIGAAVGSFIEKGKP